MDTDATTPLYDAIVIGAGINGLNQIHRLRDRSGLDVRAFEAGSDVGGTWHANRYPGARLDSESYTYGYFFSEEIYREWRWPEHYASQADVERYLRFVADKLDLRRSIDFDTTVTSARYVAAENVWEVRTDRDETHRARYLVTALGTESAPQMPENLTGLDEFEGEWHHTARWPQQPVDYAGKRVAVLGTGASGVQVITEVAKTAASLTVLQRSANYCVPLRNSPITDEQHQALQGQSRSLFEKCNQSFIGFMYAWDPRSGHDFDAAGRREVYEQLWERPGFAKWHNGFSEVYTDDTINEEFGEFVREKARARIDDPAVAEKLMPRYPFSTRRVTMDSGYYEAYNQDNVRLVDLKETPYERFTPKGMVVDGVEHEFDLIIFATGFDAFTGAFTRIDIVGENGVALKDYWADGPRTLLGIGVAGFPNFFMVTGPHTKGVFCNVPICGEQNVVWITELIAHLDAGGHTYIDPRPAAQEEWGEHVMDLYQGTMLAKSGTESYFLGTNVPGKAKTVYGYFGSVPQYAARCDEVAKAGYTDHFVIR
ncbi:flavin-containing monooxygenase [Pseudonocardia pini]|uniref:flavin-containing monooxygenase n=1 Tax=Pseudonocardia pini TaxID=2758030 RepID=UPI0015F08EA7|nr:NAD(P)/FAD-dependent oxidoreductase [Pseudonocardia pini]